MYVPSLGTSGMFSFEDPFNTDEYTSRVLTVKSIRSLDEMYKDGVDPLNNIYIKNTLTEEDYKTDFENKVPIIVFSSNAGKLYYVPCSKVKGLPVTTGVPYVRTVINVNLGALPETFNTALVREAIKDVVMNYTGIIPKIVDVPGSDVVLIDETEHKAFMAKLATTPFARNNKSLSTQLTILRNQFDSLNTEHKALQKFLGNTWNNNVIQTNRPTAADLELYAKRIKIELVSATGLDKKACLDNLLFYRRNAYNLKPKPVYMVGMIPAVNDPNGYTGMLDKTSCSFTLSKGGMNGQNLPDIFSSINHVEFDTDLNNSVSRATINITLSEIMNIMDFEMRAAMSDSVHNTKVRVMMYNEAGTIIYNVTFILGTHFNITETPGLTQYIKQSNLQLSTNIPQAEPPELDPL